MLQKTDATTGKPLVDVILDQAEQKGTGRWTSQDALDLGVPLTGITEAVFARTLSSLRDERKAAATTLAGPRPGEGGVPEHLVEDIRQALYASKIVAYAQGFAQMRAASEANGWGLDLGAMATIWRGGCIIRAQFLNRISEAYAEHGDIENLMMVPYFTRAPSREWRSRRSPARSPTTTAIAANAARPTSSRACATSSGPTPTGASTPRAASTPGGGRTARRCAPTPDAHVSAPRSRRAGNGCCVLNVPVTGGSSM